MKPIKHTIARWFEIFGVELIDNDGFRGRNIATDRVTFDEFVKGYVECTIRPVDFKRFQVMTDLLTT